MTASLDSAGKVTVVNEVHEAKAASPMLVVAGSECYYSLASLVTYYTYKLTEFCLGRTYFLTWSWQRGE